MCRSDEMLQDIGNRKFSTVLADPPWRFHNSTGKMAPEHKRVARYSTLSFEEIGKLPVESLVTETFGYCTHHLNLSNHKSINVTL